MEQKVISSLDGVEIYGIISILIFFIFFGITLIWAFALKKNYLNHMETLPLEDGAGPETDSSQPKNL